MYPAELVTKKLYLQWPARTKIQRKYKKPLKEGNSYHKYLIFTYLQDNNFEVLNSYIELDKVYLVCAETVEANVPETIQVLLPTTEQSIFMVYGSIIVDS